VEQFMLQCVHLCRITAHIVNFDSKLADTRVNYAMQVMATARSLSHNASCPQARTFAPIFCESAPN
jgi:hypothetical protein